MSGEENQNSGAGDQPNDADPLNYEGLMANAEMWPLARYILEGDYTLEEKKTLLRELRKMSPLHNRSLYMTVVVTLGLVIVITVIWGWLVTMCEPGVAIPASLIALGSTALGALAGLLAPSPREG